MCSFNSTVILVIILIGGLQFLSVLRIESYGLDSSVYIASAHNIAALGKYVFNGRPEIQYPPGFSLLLAAITRITGHEGYSVFIRTMPVFSTFGFIIWYLYLSRFVSRSVVASGTLIVATSSFAYELATQSVGSDLPFLLFSGLALWSLQRIPESVSSQRVLVRSAVAVVLTAFCVLLRSAGVSVPAAEISFVVIAAILQIPHGRRMSMVLLASSVAGFIVFGSWQYWTKHAETQYDAYDSMRNYSVQFSLKDPHRPDLGRGTKADLVKRLADNIPVQVANLTSLYTGVRWLKPVWYSPFVVGLLLLISTGVVSALRNYASGLSACYFLCYFAIYLLWPFDEGPRFMLPVSVLAFTFAYEGLRELRSQVFALAYLRGMTAIVSFVCFIAALVHVREGFQDKAYMAFWAAVFIVAIAFRAWMRISLPWVQFRRLAIVAGTVVLLLGISRDVSIARANLHPNPGGFRHHASVAAAGWLKNAPPGAVMAQDSEIINRVSNRRVEKFFVSSNPNPIIEASRRENLRYLVVDDPLPDEYYFPPEAERLQEICEKDPDLLRLVHSGPGFRIFEFRSWRADREP